ncbi:hypothetical protein ACTD5D_37060 [Nocardia takedensis]|uniref:hypothetical protein n=1 Tax=Nocardia takedensis TaxID=259390 RepID=UPI000594BBDF
MNQADGTVRAYYPGDDWYVVGTDRQDAIARLQAEFDRRIRDPAYVAEHWARTQRHLDGRESTPGFEVTRLSEDDYRRRTEELGSRLRERPDPDS